MKASGYVHVDSTDIGCSDHYLVWMELGRTTKTTRKAKRVIRKWRLERFEDREVKLKYQNALRAEVSGFSESIRGKIEKGMKGHSVVSEVPQEWEGIVNRVAKMEVGEKVIVCGRSARWWDTGVVKLRRGLH